MKPERNAKHTTALSRHDRKASQGFVDIKIKTVEQLDELIERQNKLLQNRSFLEKLPDKGQKILLFKAELETERKRKQAEYDATCQMLFNLSLNETNLDEIEWNQENLDASEKPCNSYKDNNRGHTNLLRIVATHSGTANGKTQFGLKTSNDKSVLYVDKLCEKYGKANMCQERFKPNQLKNNDRSIYISSAEKVKKMLGSKWEVTEATPPVPIYKDTVMISLSESLKLQEEQAEILKEISKKNAVEKLLQNMSVKMGDKLPAHDLMKYRSGNDRFGSNEDDYNEDDDDDDDDDDDECDDNDVEN